ncbi:MAG TPA: NAD(P)-dependent oxidoreductase [Thermoanaerobaculia bacterium]|jgi:GDP-4-dehydro-6-deoxy-D-mannose reductase|nr:NAD(P)-dependent oxidoreductase [Thermoanaerobaculia bacterium]
MGPLLVTGASGLIGRQLVPAWREAGAEVVTTARSSATVDEPGCDLAAASVAGELLRRVRPSVVVHLAGGTAGDRHELYRRNVLTTVHLLEAAAALPAPPYCIVLGSAAEYGDGGGEPLGEDAPLRPVSDYGRAKVAQTTLAEEIARRHGLALTVLRPFNLVSPALPPSVALGSLRLQLLAARGDEPAVTCGRLDVVRDYVPLGVLVEAIRALVARPPAGSVINVCSGVGLELASILAAMAARLGLRPRVAVDPALAALPAAPRVIGDPSRLRALLGLAPQPTPATLAELLLGG